MHVGGRPQTPAKDEKAADSAADDDDDDDGAHFSAGLIPTFVVPETEASSEEDDDEHDESPFGIAGTSPTPAANATWSKCTHMYLLQKLTFLSFLKN